MSIRVVRNEQANAVTFLGSNNPIYWNACLTAAVDGDDPTRINIANDFRPDSGFEFYKVPYTDFTDQEGNGFNSPQDAVDYINGACRSPVVSVSSIPADASVDFTREATNTSILLSNGLVYAVNSVRAIEDSGTISLQATNSEDGEDPVVFAFGINHSLVTIDGASPGTTINAVINSLNALFSVTPVGAGGSDPLPSFPTDGGVLVAGQSAEGVAPVTGNPLHLLTTDATSEHGARWWSSGTIERAGEYFTVKMTGRGNFAIGLYDATTDSDSNGIADDLSELLDNTGTAGRGFKWSLFFVDYGSYVGLNRSYGFSSLLQGPGANGSNEEQIRYNLDVQDAFQNMDDVLFRVGLTQEGFIGVWYYDENRSDDWILVGRSSQTPGAAEYGFAVKLRSPTATLVETPKVHRIAPVSVNPTVGSAGATLFGNATGDITTTGVIATTVRSGFNDGLLSDDTINASGEFFEITGLTLGESYRIGLFYESDWTEADVLADLNDASANTEDDYYFGGVAIGTNSATSHFLQDEGPDSSSSGYSDTTGPANNQSSPTKTHYRLGFSNSGRFTIWTSSDGINFEIARQHNTAAPSGTYKFLLKFNSAGGGITSLETGQLSVVTPAYRYIESPDGTFTWPLFASEAESDLVDQLQGGAGSSAANVFVDEPTNTTWYKPDTITGDSTVAPTNSVDITYTEIPTEADSLYTPSALTLNDHTFAENASVNIQVQPLDQTPVATVTGLPSGLTFQAGSVQGTTSYVSSDTTTTVTVSRSNNYGTTTQTFDITVTDNASLGDLTGFTEVAGNFVQPNRSVLSEDFLLTYDTTLSPGEELTYSYQSGQMPPTIGILSSTGETNLAAFDPATDTLGADSAYDFAGTSKWSLRWVTFDTHIGGSNKHALVGWDDNSGGDSGSTFLGTELKVKYDLVDGYIRLYRDDILLRTSAASYTGAQTLRLAGFDNQSQTDLYIPSNFAITNSSYGTTEPPTGFADPLAQGQMSTSTLMGEAPDEDAAVELSTDLAVNHRYIFPQSWVEANVLPYIQDDGNDFFVGVPASGASWSDVGSGDFNTFVKLSGNSNATHDSRINTLNSGTDSVTVNSVTDAYYDYAFEWDGTDLHVIACNVGDINTQPGIGSGGSFSRVKTESGYTDRTGDLPIFLGVDNGGQVNLSTTGLQQIRIPFGVRDIVVAENSNGTGDFAVQPAASKFDEAPSGHSPADFTFAGVSSLNAGDTYRFIYHPSMESGDLIEFRLASDGTTVYNTGITTFDGTSDGDPKTSEGYKGITFAVPADAPPLRLYYYNSFTSTYDNGVQRPISIAGSTYSVPVTGVTLEGPTANQTGNNLFDTGDHGWASIDETLGAGERLIMDNAFLVDLLDAMPDNSLVLVGLKNTGWANSPLDYDDFLGNCRLTLIKYSNTNLQYYFKAGTTSTATQTTNRTDFESDGVQAFLEITSTGNNVRGGLMNGTNIANSPTSTAYADWDANLKQQTGNQAYGLTSTDVMILGAAQTNNAAGLDLSDVDWTGLSEVSVPAPAATITTNWTKALDFSGGSERAKQTNGGTSYTPMKMAGVSTTVAAPSAGFTSNDGSARPWATSIVFKIDGHSSNQHIWNLGEGASNGNDNIYLRLTAGRQLFFGWGREGTGYNECSIRPDGMGSSWQVGTTHWYGIYIAHNGRRLSGSGATAANLAACFDIRLMGSSNSWATTGYSDTNISISSRWTSTGVRMDRQFGGDLTIGGRGGNRNFHGQVAAFVTTTLTRNSPMPSDAEVNKIITDPEQWLTDYKAGNSYRRPDASSNSANFTIGHEATSYSTQVWLMGDSTNDAYAKIRNRVRVGSQNTTTLDMISMVSNDIQTISIPGLT